MAAVITALGGYIKPLAARRVSEGKAQSRIEYQKEFLMTTTIARRAPRKAATTKPSIAEHLATFDTELGAMAVLASNDAVLGIVFGYPSQTRAAAALTAMAGCGRIEPCTPREAPAWLSEVCDLLTEFAAGQPVDFSRVPLNIDHLSPFESQVVAACRRIATGSTTTYGQLATRVGHPGAARAVGRVMATNRFPLVVPCHRVLSAGGSLGGYSAPDGLAMKRRLLAMESTRAR